MINQEEFIERIIKNVISKMDQESWFIHKKNQNCHLRDLIIEKMKEHVSLTDEIQVADVLCLPSTCVKTFAEIARGYTEDDQTQLILDHLSLGKKVLVIDEGVTYRKYRATSPEKLYEKWISYEEIIKSYGVKFIKVEDLIAYSKDKRISTFKEQTSSGQAKKNSPLITENVITESSLSKIANSNLKSINIKKDAIVTPLAQDYIRQEHLLLNRALDWS